MIAKSMFEELGWVVTREDENSISYEKQLTEDGFDTYLLEIVFEDNEVTFQWFDEDMDLATVTLAPTELVAIVQQLKDLGWAE
mgnify:CR=1 FL=1